MVQFALHVCENEPWEGLTWLNNHGTRSHSGASGVPGGIWAVDRDDFHAQQTDQEKGAGND
jgi:hypothetical protein